MSPSKIEREDLDFFGEFERDLIPITSKPGPYQFKKPLHNKWTTRKYKKEEIERYVKRGLNLGWRLGPEDLVIDVDPRNGGEDGLLRLLHDFDQESLETHFPTVRTGGGGFHYYAKLPRTGLKLRETIKRYPGIEFKTVGRQVVIPGSIHPSGKFYEWEERSPYDYDPPVVPNWLIELLERGETDPDDLENTIGGVEEDDEDDGPEEIIELDPDVEKLPNKDLRKLLRVLPVENYRTYSDWFELLAACHYATRGDGREVFVKWSIRDPQYKNDATKIRSVWNYLKTEGQNLRKAGSLFHEVRRYAEIRFIGSDPKDDFLGALPPDEDVPDEYDPEPPKPEKPKDALGRLLVKISKFDEETPPKMIKRILRKIRNLDPLESDKVVHALKKSTGIGVASLNKQLKEIQKAKKPKPVREEDFVEDLGQRIVEKVLKDYFADGKHLIHAKDQAFYSFEGTHWIQKPPNVIKRIILETCDELRASDSDLHFSTSPIIAQAETILVARTATERDVFKWEEGLPSVINTINAEIWIDPRTGRAIPREHRPESFLTSCLNTKYKVIAKCPIFDQTLKEIFEEEPNRRDLIRHFWEFFGYIIQPRKDIPAWWLFQGAGSNGKTLILQVMTALLGGAVLEKSILEFESSRNPHALTDLVGKLAVIDEDVKIGSLLPEDFLKKVSENKYLSANPKFRSTFRFRSCASVIMASNGYPQTRDFSLGMRRRAQVIPFKRVFARHEQDKSRARKVINKELPGVLNKALQGLERLRERGDFDVPDACEIGRSLWLESSSQIAAFIACTTIRSKGSKILFSQLWEIYKIWIIDEGIGESRSYGKRGFRGAIVDLGFKIVPGANNKRFVYDLELDPDYGPGDFLGDDFEEEDY